VIPAGWQEGILLLWSDLWNSLNKVLKSGSKKGGQKGGVQAEYMNELPASFSTVRAGILDSHLVLAVAKGTQFSRAIGPGYVRLERGEVIHEVIDLRQQHRSQPVHVRTRDGIPLETTVSAMFHIARLPANEADPQTPFPYDKESVFLASYATSMTDNNQHRKWSDRILPIVADAVVAEISRYTLDDLYSTGGIISLAQLKSEIRKKMVDKFVGMGIQIVHVGIGQFEIDKRVAAQRFENWKARWQCRIDVTKAQNEAEITQLRNEFYAGTQREILNQIAERIEQVKNKSDLKDVVLIQIIQTLEQSAAGNPREVIFPKAAMEAARLLQEMLGEDPKQKSNRPPQLSSRIDER
jgi:hypothetical protein